MSSKSRHGTKTSRFVPSAGSTSFRYSPIWNCHDSDFPISDPIWEVDNKPESEPVLEMHSHDGVEVGYCHKGSGILFADKQMVPFKAGDVSLVGENVLHMSRHTIGQPSHWSYFWVDQAVLLAGLPDAVQLLAENPFAKARFPCIFSPTRHGDICHSIRIIVAELAQRSAGYRTIVKSQACSMFALVHRACQHLEQGKCPSDSEGILRVSPAMHYIMSHYAEPIAIDDLAKLSSLSRRQFYRRFLSAVGQTPHQYLAQFRTRMAAAILSSTNKPVTQVAFDVGFESLCSFNRQFRAVMKVSPVAWRKHCHRE